MSGPEIGRVPIPPCRCGESDWEEVAGNEQCRACGTIYVVEEEIERPFTADGYRPEHVMVRHPLDDAGDRRVLASFTFTGTDGKPADDQRPEHDPEQGVYRPICIAQHLGPPGSSVYTYLLYCGSCRRQWGSLGTSHGWEFCPYCATQIGHYTFRDGVEDWYRESLFDLCSPPEVWPNDDG